MLPLVSIIACAEPAPPAVVPPLDKWRVEPESQRAGDPAAGLAALLERDSVGCGIPETVMNALPGDFYGGIAGSSAQLPGRTGAGADLPYYLNRVSRDAGYDSLVPNCLLCHASEWNGEVVVGLGATTIDYTDDFGPTARTAASYASFLTSDPNEQAELRKWAERIEAIAPYIQLESIGVNAADSLATALFAHRRADTLEWSETLLLDPPPTHAVPVDVPPWWRMGKKNAMFYTAGGRGDHARIMMSASALCTDSVEQAAAIDAWFGDVRAFIGSLEPPAWPFALDTALAERGRGVFESTCSECHGRYGDDGEYPNWVVSIDEVGTDDYLARGEAWAGGRFSDWFNRSFYGETARLEPQVGYVAPPLDGVWASAPYLHNGSVPSIAALLESPVRPTYWRRTFDSTDYDPATLGWRYETLDGKANDPAVYDTTQLGYSNRGHTFGDALTADERFAVLEFLKTL
jgi:hypothetical protein